jgi:VanZ family protein
MHPRSQPTQLPQYFAALYGLMIVYASLQPFSGWMAPLPGSPFFLFAPWPPRFTRADIVINVVAYMPFGFFVALIGAQHSPMARFAAATAAGALLSLAMETTQMYLPMRDASTIDVITNSAGAAMGGLAALGFNRAAVLRSSIARWRHHLFLGGHSGDLGLALLGIWLASQVNPGIPLFAVTFDPSRDLTPDQAGTLLVAAQSAFSTIGVGLFLALLLRQRRHIGGALLFLGGAALVLKGVAAGAMLKPSMWNRWLNPGVSLGVAIGACGLLLAVRLPRPARTAVCAVALLSSLVAPMLAPDLWHAHPPLASFDWSYGQLLNFNGLTHATLVVWPIVASAYLLLLAGKPGWGDRAAVDDRV